MNTPTHIVISYAALRGRSYTKADTLALFSGAILPDIVIYGLFFGALITGIPQSTLWDHIYFLPQWQNAIDIFNSIPLSLLILAAGIKLKKRWLSILALSFLLHIAGDIFLHNDDAHRHFYPLSQWQLISPVSYWDQDHFGYIGMLAEACTLLVATIFLWAQLSNTLIKSTLILYNVALFSGALLFSFQALT